MERIDTAREDFPILKKRVYNRPLVYLDNAATTQKPQRVIDRIAWLYANLNANVHRGVHFLSEEATEAMEEAREKIRSWIGAEKKEEIVFTRGTTEGLNLVASSMGELLREGDEVVTTVMEHHSNMVPWQLLRDQKGIRLRYVDITDEGEIDLEQYARLLNERTKVVAVGHVSNVLGTINPVERMAEMAHKAGAVMVVDGAQGAPHLRVDVKRMGCDFYALSAHKMYGPTGVGILYGKEEWLDRLPPYQAGGEMISTVSLEKTTFERLPYKFEAGTPNFIGNTAMGTVIDYLKEIGMENIERKEEDLCRYALERLGTMEGVTLYGGRGKRAAVVALNLKGVHHLDAGTLLDRLGIAVRTGHHCAEPLMKRLGVNGVVRASMAFYNDREEIDRLCEGLERVRAMF